MSNLHVIVPVAVAQCVFWLG